MTTIKLILAAILFLTANQVKAQTDTTYFDENWNIIYRDFASYYRISTKTGSTYDVKDYYISGVLQMEGTFSSLKTEKREGFFKFYRKEGTLTSEGLYMDGDKQGKWKHYDSQGKMYKVDHFENGILHGESEMFYDDGNLKRREVYKGGRFVRGHCYSIEGDEISYFPYEQQPLFKGGNEALMQYLQNNMVYPVSAYRKDIQGTVHLRFVVDVDGKVSDVKVTKNVHPLLDEEAIFVVSNMPNWIPGKIDGLPVKSYFDMPVTFRLN